MVVYFGQPAAAWCQCRVDLSLQGVCGWHLLGQQVNIANQQRQSAASTTTNTVTINTTTVTNNNSAAGHLAECKALDASITQYDAMARQPQTGQMQDWITGEKKKARDRQFRIHC